MASGPELLLYFRGFCLKCAWGAFAPLESIYYWPCYKIAWPVAQPSAGLVRSGRLRGILRRLFGVCGETIS